MTDETVVGGAGTMNVDTHIVSESLKVVEEVATEKKGMVDAGEERLEAAPLVEWGRTVKKKKRHGPP